MFIWTFFDHKNLGNHLLQLCPKVVKHPVYRVLFYCRNIYKEESLQKVSQQILKLLSWWFTSLQINSTFTNEKISGNTGLVKKKQEQSVSMCFVRRNVRWYLSAFRSKSQEINRSRSSVCATTELHHVTFKFKDEIIQMVMYWKWYLLVSHIHTPTHIYGHMYRCTLGLNYREHQACIIYNI